MKIMNRDIELYIEHLFANKIYKEDVIIKMLYKYFEYSDIQIDEETVIKYIQEKQI
jgi:hypothetical protein